MIVSSVSDVSAQTPVRSLEQRMEALRRANEIRIRRSQIKRDLREGIIRIDALLLEPPAEIVTAKVVDLLLAVPRVGQVKATKWLNAARISTSKTVGGLSERQRQELLDLLRP